MFIADVVSVASVLTTIAEKKTQYSTAEVKMAEVAHELLKNAGYPLAGELMNLVGDGNILDMPALTRSDIVRAYDIFGQPSEYVRGKLTKKKVNRVTFDAALRSEEVQTLWADVMHIDQNSFFVSVAEPMQLIMLNSIRSEDAESLGEALQDQLNLLRERSFQLQLVYVDPVSGLMSLRTQFLGVVIDLCGVGDFMSKIDICIHRLKEMYRAVKAGLPWTLPKSRVKDLMMYCVSCMNLRCMSALDGTVCPKVLVTGLKPNYRKELSLAFGDYVEVHTGTDNTSRERSVTCIALYPVGNATGMWQFWNIINGIAEDEHGTEGVTDNLPETPDPDEEKSKEGDAEENQDEEAEKEKAQSNKGETTTVPDTGGQTLGQTSRRNARIAAGVKPSEWFVHASFVERKRWQEEAAKEAIKVEIRQL
jgi:hypothetical protein